MVALFYWKEEVKERSQFRTITKGEEKTEAKVGVNP